MLGELSWKQGREGGREREEMGEEWRNVKRKTRKKGGGEENKKSAEKEEWKVRRKGE